VRLTSQRQAWELSALCNLLVIDAPGYADISTLELAERSDLLVLTTVTNLIELEPTVLLMRELMSHGIKQEKEARGYLKAAKLEALEPSLGWFKATHDIATDGRTVTESPNGRVDGRSARATGRRAQFNPRVHPNFILTKPQPPWRCSRDLLGPPQSAGNSPRRIRRSTPHGGS
jgi:hypothetical protein